MIKTAYEKLAKNCALQRYTVRTSLLNYCIITETRAEFTSVTAF